MSNSYMSGAGSTHTTTARSHRNGSGVGALVTGIIGVVLSWYWPAGLVLGVVAVVCGVVGRKSAARGEATNAGTATAGLVLGIIGLVLTAVFAAFIISAAM